MRVCQPSGARRCAGNWSGSARTSWRHTTSAGVAFSHSVKPLAAAARMPLTLTVETVSTRISVTGAGDRRGQRRGGDRRVRVIGMTAAGISRHHASWQSGSSAPSPVDVPDHRARSSPSAHRADPFPRPAACARRGPRCRSTCGPASWTSLGGGEVVEAVSQTGGFSPGPAVRLRTSAGRRAFVKAVSAETNPDSPDMHRREAALLRPDAGARAGAQAPRRPGRGRAGWSWSSRRSTATTRARTGIRRSFAGPCAALGELAEPLTPSPIDAPPVAERLAGFTGWRGLGEGARGRRGRPGVARSVGRRRVWTGWPPSRRA